MKSLNLKCCLWSACALFAIVGLYVMHKGGWGQMAFSPFPIQLVRQVYHTNEVYVKVPMGEQVTTWVTNNMLTNGLSFLNTLVVTDLYVTNFTVFYNSNLYGK